MFEIWTIYMNYNVRFGARNGPSNKLAQLELEIAAIVQDNVGVKNGESTND